MVNDLSHNRFDAPRETQFGLGSISNLSDDQLEALATSLAPHLRRLLDVNQKATSKSRKTSSLLRFPFNK